MSNEAWSWLLLILAILGWVSTVTLVRAADSLPEAALQERATVAVICSVASTLIAILAAIVLLGFRIPRDTATSLLLGACVLINVPPLLWGAMLVTGRFR